MSVAVIFPVVAPPYAAKTPAVIGKPFAKIDSREVFLRSVELYAKRDQVTQRILVVTPDDLQTIQEKYANHLAFQGVSVTAGTSEWFGCVARGLEKLEAGIETVIVHDPCCPAVSFSLSDALEEALEKNKGAAGVVPVVASCGAYAELDGSRVSEYVEMAGVHQVQAPQVFRRKALVEAYAKRGGKIFVDDAELVVMTGGGGGKIVTVPGSRLNQRIDSEEIIRLGRDLIEHLPKPKPKTPLNPFGEAEW